jgi:hypothetical protein
MFTALRGDAEAALGRDAFVDGVGLQVETRAGSVRDDEVAVALFPAVQQGDRHADNGIADPVSMYTDPAVTADGARVFEAEGDSFDLPDSAGEISVHRVCPNVVRLSRDASIPG